MSQLLLETDSAVVETPAIEVSVEEVVDLVPIEVQGPPTSAERQRHYEEIAYALASSSAEERASAYAHHIYTRRELSMAAALRPDLMPLVNGEFEWIALTLADLD